MRTTKYPLPCVYAITCTNNGMRYVGCTTDFIKREFSHYTLLNKGTHYNKPLQSDWDKYGEDAFGFNILQEYKTVAQARRVESYNINLHYNELYNVMGHQTKIEPIHLSDDCVSAIERIGWSVKEFMELGPNLRGSILESLA